MKSIKKHIKSFIKYINLTYSQYFGSHYLTLRSIYEYVYVLSHIFGLGYRKNILSAPFFLLMTFKMSFHTIEVRLNIVTYPQQPLCLRVGSDSRPYVTSTTALTHLHTTCYSAFSRVLNNYILWSLHAFTELIKIL